MGFFQSPTSWAQNAKNPTSFVSDSTKGPSLTDPTSAMNLAFGRQAQSPYQAGKNPAMDMMLKQAGNIAGGGGGFGTPQNKPKPASGNSPQSTNPQITPQKPLPGTGYTPTTAPYGMDQTNPGVAEQFWNQNQNLWMQPPGGQQGAFGGRGAGQQFWNQIQGGYNQASQSLQPQFDAAFDRAKEQAVGTANQQAAARGAYGSSAALNNVGNVAANVEAQRAGAASDFALQNAANQRAATGLYGNLAFGAGREAQQGINDDLARTNAGFAAALATQNARRGRTQDAFGNQLGYLNTVLPWAQGQYENAFNADQGAFDASQGAGLAGTQFGVQQADNRYNRNMSAVNSLIQVPGAYKAGQDSGLW